jgi:hypothetical protein
MSSKTSKSYKKQKAVVQDEGEPVTDESIFPLPPPLPPMSKAPQGAHEDSWWDEEEQFRKLVECRIPSSVDVIFCVIMAHGSLVFKDGIPQVTNDNLDEFCRTSIKKKNVGILGDSVNRGLARCKYAERSPRKGETFNQDMDLEPNNIVNITTCIVHDYNEKRDLVNTFPTKSRLQKWTDHEMRVKRPLCCELQEGKSKYLLSTYYSDNTSGDIEGIMIHFNYRGIEHYYNILNIDNLRLLVSMKLVEQDILDDILTKNKSTRFMYNTNYLFYILKGLKEKMRKSFIYLVDYSCKDCKDKSGNEIKPPDLPPHVGHGGFFKKISKTKKTKKTKKQKKPKKTKKIKNKKTKNQ